MTNDALTALIRRTLAEGECNTCSGPHLDREAARLAEVFLNWYAAKDVARGRETERRIGAARESESEAVALLRELVWVRPADPDREREAIQDARAYLARRKEASR